jgi:MFS family permease
VLAGIVVCNLPVFLVGALSVELRAALHLGPGGLGAVVALFYLGAATMSIPLGSVVERVGQVRMMRWACALSAVILALVAATSSWPFLGVIMVAGGSAASAMQLGANVFIARRVPDNEQGIAFGWLQAAVPLTTALSGLALPALALTVGWRWAFALAALGAGVAAVTLPHPEPASAQAQIAGRRTPDGELKRGPLLVLATAMGLGMATASALTAFLVASAITSGVGHAAAGLLIAFAAVLGAVSRIVTGSRADRSGGPHMTVVAVMLMAGALGYGLLGLASAYGLIGLYLPAAAIAFAAGWGWNGLMIFTVVRSYPTRPAQATAVTQAGARLGAMLGPFAFGQLVVHGSYAMAWAVTAATAICAAGVSRFGQRLMITS